MGSKTLGELCSRVYTGGTPKSGNVDFYRGGNIPWLNTREISFNRIRQTAGFITEAGLAASSAKWVQPNAVIVAMYGATAGKCAIAKIPLTTNQACCNLEIDDSIADYRYIYYWLMSRYTQIVGMANGAAQQNLNVKQIRELSISLPELGYQKKVAELLSLLDAKVDLNRQANDYLVELVRTEFDHRFGEGTPTTDLSDLLTISTMSIAPMEYLGETWELFSIPAFDENHRPVFERADEIKSNKYVIDNDCILISKLNPSTKRLWLPCCTSTRSVCSTEFIVYKPRRPEHKSFYYAAIDSPRFLEYLLAHITGSTGSRQRVQVKATLSYPMPNPHVESIDEFCEFADPIIARRQSNEQESRRLEEIRDTLLPKLMSGEIDVSEVKLPMQPNNHLSAD